MNILKVMITGSMVFGAMVMTLSAADTHKLESTDGKVIEAKIISVTDTVASIHVGKQSIAGNNYMDRAGAIGNHLGGIWLRIYDKEDKMVYEWKSIVTKVNEGEWKQGGKE